MKLIYFLSALTSIFILSSCSGDNKNSKVPIEIIPDSPIVFTGDITIPVPGTGENETITGPWFRFRYKIANNIESGSAASEIAGNTVTIVGIEVEITDSAGNTSSNSSFDPFEVGRSVFVELPPVASGSDNTFVDPLNFYVSGLTEGTNLRYKVDIIFKGWFGTEAEPVDRFQKVITVNTQ